MKIVCIILNYNDALTTLRLVECIKEYNSLDNILIVDNCSTDNSYYVLEKRIVNDKVKLLKTDKNGGYGYGNNFGIRYSYKELAASHIIIANPDVEFSKAVLGSMIKAFDNEKCAIVAPLPRLGNGQFQKNPAWRLVGLYQEVLSASVFFNKFIGSKKTYTNHFIENKDIVPVDIVQGSLLMINASIMINHGMYDEEFFLFMEEQVLAKKMIDAGYQSYLLPNDIYIHHHSVTIKKALTSLLGKNKVLQKSRLLYLKKYLNMTSIQELFVKLFFLYCLAEVLMITFLRRKK